MKKCGAQWYLMENRKVKMETAKHFQAPQPVKG